MRYFEIVYYRQNAHFFAYVKQISKCNLPNLIAKKLQFVSCHLHLFRLIGNISGLIDRVTKSGIEICNSGNVLFLQLYFCLIYYTYFKYLLLLSWKITAVEL